MYLNELQPGQKGRVLSINKGPNASRRLFEIGLVPGAIVQVVSRHPFKGPLLIQIGNTRVAVGQRVASFVEIEISE